MEIITSQNVLKSIVVLSVAVSFLILCIEILVCINNSCLGYSSMGEYMPSNLHSFSCSIPSNMRANILLREAACLFLAAKTQNNHSENYII